MDLLALRTNNDPAVVERLIVEIASVDVDDGVVFLLDTVTAGPIRGGDVYPGVRAAVEARLATARIKFSVDVNVGDPVVPAPIRTAVPVLLGDERIEVLAYPKSMVIAEKLVTALQRGRASSRWRDFADLFMLVRGNLIEAEVIEGLRAVASHRGVSLQPLGEVLAGMAKEAQALGDVAGALEQTDTDGDTIPDLCDTCVNEPNLGQTQGVSCCRMGIPKPKFPLRAPVGRLARPAPSPSLGRENRPKARTTPFRVDETVSRV